jgi:MFS family permease
MPAVGPLVRRFGGQRILAAGTSLYIVMYVGIALAQNPLGAAALFALPLYGMVNVSANTLASEYSATAQRGGGLGVLNGTYALATIVGPLAGGALADRLGLGVIPWASLAFAAIASVIAWHAVATRRNGN